MPYTPPVRTGNWVALQDLAGVRGGKTNPFAGVAIRVTRGFLESDDSNTYKGDPAPRFVIHGVLVGKEDEGEYMITSRKGGSRDSFLQGAADYLEGAPTGSYIDIGAEPVEGSQYIQLVVVDSFDAE